MTIQIKMVIWAEHKPGRLENILAGKYKITLFNSLFKYCKIVSGRNIFFLKIYKPTSSAKKDFNFTQSRALNIYF